MVRNSQATKLDMFSMKTSNRPRNVFSSLTNQDASATIKNHSRLISGKLKMNWFKLDMRNKEITSLNSSTLSRIKANKDKQLDKVVSKWVNNNLTTTSHNLVNLMMVSKTKEVEWEEAEACVDVEEAAKIEAAANTGIRIMANSNSSKNHMARKCQVSIICNQEWTTANKWQVTNHRTWCHNNNSNSLKWWIINRCRCNNKELCSFHRSTQMISINFKVMKETTLLETTSTCLSCKPLVKNLPQPLLVCFLMSQLLISSFCLLKTNTSFQRLAKLMNFSFRASNNNSRPKCSNMLNQSTNEVEDATAINIFIRTGQL